MTVRQYRHEVMGRVRCEWPQEVSPQVFRTRLAAYKEQLCDANYLSGVCVCVRMLRTGEIAAPACARCSSCFDL